MSGDNEYYYIDEVEEGKFSISSHLRWFQDDNTTSRNITLITNADDYETESFIGLFGGNHLSVRQIFIKFI